MPLPMDNPAALSCGCNHQQNFGFALDAGGLPEGATGFIDFTDMTFYTEGGNEDIVDIIGSNVDWGYPFDPEAITLGVGLSGTSGEFLGTCRDILLAGGVVVFDVEVSAGVADGRTHYTIFDVPDQNYLWLAMFGTVEHSNPLSSSLVAASGADPRPPLLTIGNHKIADQFAAGVCKCCTDGGDVIVADTTDYPANFGDFNTVAFAVDAGINLRTITIYPPPMNDAEMQALSSL